MKSNCQLKLRIIYNGYWKVECSTEGATKAP